MGSISKPLDRSNIIVLGESILPSPVAARLLIFMGTLGLLGLFVLGPHSSMWNLSSQLYVCAQLYLFVTPQTVVCQASQSIRFSRQEYWSRLLCPPGDLPRSRDPTWVSCVSCTGRRILYHWATWEAPYFRKIALKKKKRTALMMPPT